MNAPVSALKQPLADFLNSALVENARKLSSYYNHPESLAILERLYTLQPTPEIELALADCVMAYAKSEQEVGRLDHAESLLRRVLNLSSPPDEAIKLLSIVCFQKATGLIDQELFYQAEAALCESLALNPDFDKAQNLLQQIPARVNGREPTLPREKLAMKEAKLRRDGGEKEALAYCLVEQVKALLAMAPDHVKAEALWRAAFKLLPKNREIVIGLVTALFNRAYIGAMYFEHAEAEYLVWNVLAHFPDFELAREILKRCVDVRTGVFVLGSGKYHANACKLAECLRVMDPVGPQFIRVGGERDGGYVMVDHGLDNAVVYSLGVGGDVSWDSRMAERGNQIYQYDHTIDKLPEEHPRFHWEKLGIGTDGETNPIFRSIKNLIAANGHAERRDLILKIDIEGAEWPILAEIDDAVLGRFSQIVGEFHSFFDIADEKRAALILKALHKINTQFQLVHVHANNICPPRFIGGYTFSGNYELTFLRRSGQDFATCERRFPTELDFPCIPIWPDQYIGRGGF